MYFFFFSAKGSLLLLAVPGAIVPGMHRPLSDSLDAISGKQGKKRDSWKEKKKHDTGGRIQFRFIGPASPFQRQTGVTPRQASVPVLSLKLLDFWVGTVSPQELATSAIGTPG